MWAKEEIVGCVILMVPRRNTVRHTVTDETTRERTETVSEIVFHSSNRPYANIVGGW
jgi:hypothetical protein